MRNLVFLILSCFIFQYTIAQKKPLDHSVYDGWQSIGEKMISNNGRWVVYTIDPQEGDNELVIQSSDGQYKKTVSRGYGAVITEDSRFVICRIRPLFKDARDARIKKKKTEELPKDSLAIVELGKDSTLRIGKVRNYKTPDKSSGWVAYQLEKAADPATKTKTSTDNRRSVDSLARVIDSLTALLETPTRKRKNIDDTAYGFEYADADGDEAVPSTIETGTDLVLRKLVNGQEKVFKNVLEYYFSKNGSKLLLEQARDSKDSLSKTKIFLYDLRKGFGDTLSIGGNEFKNFALSEDGSQVAYIAERDARPKDLQRFYKIWYYKEGMDSARMLVDKNAVGMKLGMTISEFGTVSFSKSGQRLFFGTGLIQPPKDTTLVEADLAKLDIWHYNDDYLQTIQLFRLTQDLHENFLAVYQFDKGSIEQLGSKEIPVIYQTGEGDGEIFTGVSDFGKRVESQWTGTTKKDIYSIRVNDGTKKLVKKDLQGVINQNYISPGGRYIMWYDSKLKNYFTYDGESANNITGRIKLPLYNEENDQPTEPGPYGIMGWQDEDSAVFVYDRFDIWKIKPGSPSSIPLNITNTRKNKIANRFVLTDPDKKTIGQKVLTRQFNEVNKKAGLSIIDLGDGGQGFAYSADAVYIYSNIRRAEDSVAIIYTKENYRESPDLYISKKELQSANTSEIKLSSINPQQKEYNWGTAELYKWKTFTGKSSEGILYKPEDFNPGKKYPLILYFYEKLSEGLYGYMSPSPTPSRLNISFFVSRGYLVFTPDITYTVGHPAKSAYDFIVSAAKDLAKHQWVDAANMGIQGQSWGGIQVAQLITMTDLFKAAWAGAPVANMTSAYGGIRWESGANREFQYEKTQSRIGATLWEKPELYIENSPLFQLPKVKTPLVIMSNDADGAVPWYQGIELFTGMRRLGKKVWLLNYNGEAHNLVQRRNRKDIQIREQQYFDWLLKGEKPAKWITEGLPAVRKGRDWGLDISN